MLRTRFTDLVGCSIPIQQAGMGAASPPELAAAVSEAGGLGMLGIARPDGMAIDALNLLLDRVSRLTSRPFGVNILVPPHNRPQLDLAAVDLAARRARVVEFFYGWPEAELVDRVHGSGALAFWQVGSREEAVAALEVGTDVVVAQGIAAGGHVRGKIGLAALLGEVLPVVDVPVLAAGGIGDGRAVAAALTAGASGVRVGTRFVAAVEANAHPTYVEKLIGARAQDTVYTEAFSVTWPNAPHRCLRSSVEAATATQEEIVGDRLTVAGTRVPIRRFQSVVPDTQTRGNIEAMPFWAGESVSAVTRIQPAADILHELITEAERLLDRSLAATVLPA